MVGVALSLELTDPVPQLTVHLYQLKYKGKDHSHREILVKHTRRQRRRSYETIVRTLRALMAPETTMLKAF